MGPTLRFSGVLPGAWLRLVHLETVPVLAPAIVAEADELVQDLPGDHWHETTFLSLGVLCLLRDGQRPGAVVAPAALLVAAHAKQLQLSPWQACHGSVAVMEGGSESELSERAAANSKALTSLHTLSRSLDARLVADPLAAL